MFVDMFTFGHCDFEAVFTDMLARPDPAYSTFKQIAWERPVAAPAKAMVATSGA